PLVGAFAAKHIQNTAGNTSGKTNTVVMPKIKGHLQAPDISAYEFRSHRELNQWIRDHKQQLLSSPMEIALLAAFDSAYWVQMCTGFGTAAAVTDQKSVTLPSCLATSSSGTTTSF